MPVARDGEPVARLTVDPALADDPKLLQSAAAATAIALGARHADR